MKRVHVFENRRLQIASLFATCLGLLGAVSGTVASYAGNQNTTLIWSVAAGVLISLVVGVLAGAWEKGLWGAVLGLGAGILVGVLLGMTAGTLLFVGWQNIQEPLLHASPNLSDGFQIVAVGGFFGLATGTMAGFFLGIIAAQAVARFRWIQEHAHKPRPNTLHPLLSGAIIGLICGAVYGYLGWIERDLEGALLWGGIATACFGLFAGYIAAWKRWSHREEEPF